MGAQGAVRGNARDDPMYFLIGQELKQAREKAGLSRVALVAKLADGVGDRTLLSWEQGVRRIEITRLIEICTVLSISVLDLIGTVLDQLETPSALTLRVNTHALAADRTHGYKRIQEWARRRCPDTDKAIVIASETVREMAAMANLTHDNLARYLLKFSVIAE